MKTRETLLGVIVLGLVLTGVLWVRFRPWTSPGASAGPAAPSLAPTAASGRRSPGPPVPGSAAALAMPDVTLADGAVDLGDVRVILSVTPRPPVAFAKNRFRVRVVPASSTRPADGQVQSPLPLENGRISFEMTMPMGDHRYALVPGEGGWHDAEVVLPMCPSGNPRWYATVEGTVAGRMTTARFRLDLAKPGTAPSP